jgi:serine protease Do
MIRRLRPCSFVLVFVTLLARVLHAAEVATEPPPIWLDASPSDVESELDRVSRAYIRLANEVRPAIVQIRVAALSEAQTSVKTQPQGSRGSGFIIHPDGYVLTAQHVIDKAKEIEVRLGDLQRIPAKLIAADAQTDLALLKIDAERELPVLPLGDSDTIRVGELAVVLGYPFCGESAMIFGIISPPRRTNQD